MNQEKVKEKIKKLLRLSMSSNENEAMLAMKKAQELLAKHKLKMTDVDEAEQSVVTVDTGIYYTKLKDYWKAYLIDVVSENYCVETYIKKEYGAKRRQICLVGMKLDIEICIDVFNFAADHIEKWFKDYKREEGWKYSAKYLNAIKNDYGKGFAFGLSGQLERQKEEKAQEWGLVMMVPEEAKNYVAELSEDKSKAKPNFSGNAEITFRGYIDGESLKMQDTLTGNAGAI